MSLEKQVMEHMKLAMKAKDTVALESLRAVKSAMMLAKTEGGAGGELTEDQELKILQKQVKQRKDSAALYIEQGRQDLADAVMAQVVIIEQFLPEALSEEAIAKVVEETIAKVGASGMQEMGKVMGIVSKQLAGQADGKTISGIVRKALA